MHLTEGTLSTTTVIMTSGAGLCAFGAACWGSRKELSLPRLLSWSVMTGFILAAQMVNCSLGLGFSGHLLGAALLTMFFGPWSALLSMGLVLTIQAVFLGDGSISTLGVNFINMGVVAVGSAHWVFRLVQGKRRMLQGIGQLYAMALASYVSTLAAALSLGLILGYALGGLLASYALIGALEAGLSVAIFHACARYQNRAFDDASEGSLVLPLLLASLMAVCLLPFGSQLPDGMEKALEASSVGIVE